MKKGYSARTEWLNIDRILHIFTWQPTWISVRTKQDNVVKKVIGFINKVKNIF